MAKKTKTSTTPLITTRMSNEPVTIIGADLEALRDRRTGEIQAHNLWVKVRRADGSEREWGVWELRAPQGGLDLIMSEVYRVNPALKNEQF